MFQSNEKTIRNSGIDLLKIIAMLMIVIFHTIQTITKYPEFYPEFSQLFYDFYSFYKIDNFQTLLLTIIFNFGQTGNYLFFICTAWFLCDDDNVKIKKVIKIILNTWVISVIFLGVYYLLGTDLSYQTIKNNLIPITTERNWYVLLYLIVYLVHPLLNSIINKTDKKPLFIILGFLMLVYFGVCYFKRGYYYSSLFFDYIIIYLFIAFCKKHYTYIDNKKANILIFFSSLFLYVLLVVVSYNYGDPITKWTTSNSFFLLIMSFSLFNIFKSININSKFVNGVSSLTLLIYLIHENDLFRNITRVSLMSNIILNYGYTYIGIIALLIGICLFIISAIVAFVYSVTIKKIVDYIADKISIIINKLIGIISDYAINNFFSK